MLYMITYSCPGSTFYVCTHFFIPLFPHTFIPLFRNPSFHHSFNSLSAFLHSSVSSFLHSFISSFLHSCVFSFLHFCVSSFLHSSMFSFFHSSIPPIPQAIRQSMASVVPQEPETGCSEKVSTLRIRLPDGSSTQRRFLASHTIQVSDHTHTTTQ